MAGLIESLMAMWWFNRKDRFVANSEDKKYWRELDRQLIRNGFISYTTKKNVDLTFRHDALALLDRVVGTLDRESPEWKLVDDCLHRNEKKYIDGYEYDSREYFLNEYCMKFYGVKYPSYEVVMRYP